jgi:AraC family transcriptional regulator
VTYDSRSVGTLRACDLQDLSQGSWGSARAAPSGDGGWVESIAQGKVTYGVSRTSTLEIEVQDHLFGILFNPGVVRWGHNAQEPADLVCRARSFYFVPAGSTIKVRKDHPTENFHVIAKREWLDQELARFQYRPSTMIYNLKDDEVSEAALTLRNRIIRGDPSAGAGAPDLFYKMTVALIKHQPSGRATPRCRLSARQLRVTLDYINSHIHAQLTLPHVAQAAGGLSEFHFAHAFSNSLGQSLHQYIIDRRVAHAATLLSTGQRSLAEVAYSVGFSSQAHMTDTFRKRLNVTPGELRQRNFVCLPSSAT